MDIANKGFHKLNIDIEEETKEKLAKEAAGSPQLMQMLCLQVCFEKEIEETQDSPSVVELTDDDIISVFERTVGYTSHETIVDLLYSRKDSRGKSEQNVHLKI